MNHVALRVLPARDAVQPNLNNEHLRRRARGLMPHIPSKEVVATYKSIKARLGGNDDIIFASMSKVAREIDLEFTPPTDPSHFPEKHQEIEKDLKTRMLGRDTLPLLLIEEIVREAQRRGGLQGIGHDQLLENATFKTHQTQTFVRLSSDLRWTAVWQVPGLEESEASLEVYSHDWGEIVPTFIVEYIDTAINAFRARMSLTATALVSIAMEATLRDVLIANDIPYDPYGSRVDVYQFTKAEVTEHDGSYLVTILEPTPKQSTDFAHSTNGEGKLPIELRRTKRPNDERWDVQVKMPQALLDHWTSDAIQQAAKPRVSGLGDALQIARDRQLLTPAVLPIDLDEIITEVRNNLVHLSGDVLDRPRPRLEPRGFSTLQELLQKQDMVLDLLLSVTGAVNDLYIQLRQTGQFAE